MSTPSARIISGRYVLERPIAEHGMEDTWAAVDRELGRPVAVKLLADGTLRAQGVLSAAARIQSPHVEPIYDHGYDDSGDEFFVTELAEGEYLDARLHRLGSLPLPALAAIIQQVAHGLNAIHSAGVVHNGIKPARIFLARTATGEVAKIGYGISLVLWSGTDVAKMMSGTPPYMSPEQVQGAVSPRSDLWALSVVCYEGLTGQLPFTAIPTAEVMAEICNAAHPPPSHLVPALGPEVDLFFERALAKDPTQRFQSVTEMATAFAALAAGSPSNAFFPTGP